MYRNTGTVIKENGTMVEGLVLEQFVYNTLHLAVLLIMMPKTNLKIIST